MIQINVAENGYITLDFTREDAERTGITRYGRDRELRLNRIVTALTGSTHIESKWCKRKRGLANQGFVATYLDLDRHAQYRREAGYDQ